MTAYGERKEIACCHTWYGVTELGVTEWILPSGTSGKKTHTLLYWYTGSVVLWWRGFLVTRTSLILRMS